MPNFIEPNGYGIRETQIEVTNFLDNDFDMELIPEVGDKENIPVLDHYITFPTNHELASEKYSYMYNHKDYSNFIPYKSFNNFF